GASMTRRKQRLRGLFLLASVALCAGAVRAEGLHALFAFGGYGTENGKFNLPGGVAASPDGKILVSDTDNHRIQLFDAAGSFLSTFGSLGFSGNGQFKFPYGVAVRPDGTIVVADTTNRRIQIFDSAGSFQFMFGSRGSANGQFEFPFGVAARPD